MTTKTIDELMALALHMVGEAADEDERRFDVAKAALRSALEQFIESAGADRERYQMLSRMLFHGDFEVGEAYVTMKIVGTCPSPADLDREVDAAIDAARSPQPGDRT